MNQPSELRVALSRQRQALLGVALFSAAVNLLMLTGPLFMLQVYDRVLLSRAEATLLVLFTLVVFLYGLMGLLDAVRGRVLARVGASVQSALDSRVFRATLTEAENPEFRVRPASGLQDLAAIQTLLASPVMGALFDLPWTPLYIAVLFLFHPLLGWAGVGGAIWIFVLALMNQRATRSLRAMAERASAEAEAQTARTRAGIETVRGLGMTGPMLERWSDIRHNALSARMKAADAGGGYAAATKATRLLLQSAMLGLGAWLVLQDALGPGAMIAGSILLGRALAPIEQTVGQWPMVEHARRGWRSLTNLLDRIPEPPAPMKLPAPEGRLQVTNLSVAVSQIAGSSRQILLRDVSFSLGPGEAVAVIGPSGAGKSTLARALAGLISPTNGEIRLSGASTDQYAPDVLGKAIGYLPQQVTLFPGTVAENIARFEQDAAPERIVAAAKAAAAHDLILSLPDGYNTSLSADGSPLSGGEKQRLALARALYGDPVLLILDEPNSALDDAGVNALDTAMRQARAAGRAVVLMSHRASALTACDQVLLLDHGEVRAYGPRDKVLERLGAASNIVQRQRRTAPA